MLDCWLYLRLHRRWASQAYALSKFEIEPVLIGASLIAIGLLRI